MAARPCPTDAAREAARPRLAALASAANGPKSRMPGVVLQLLYADVEWNGPVETHLPW